MEEIREHTKSVEIDKTINAEKQNRHILGTRGYVEGVICMDIHNYCGKHVSITDIDGKVFRGYAAYYTSELDDPDGIASLSIEPDGEDGHLISFTADEISHIELAASDFAKAI